MMFVQVDPSPVYPSWQTHWNPPPTKSTQNADVSHDTPALAHAMLEQTLPSPAYPALHAQVKLPKVLLHAASAEQGLEVHSSTSMHPVPFPEYPPLHVHV